MIRVGFGYDLHRLTEGRDLILGGVILPFHKGEEAHSDGDVLLHAVIDALLGALALGDIGTHFPPSDDKWKDISSRILLQKTMEMVKERGWRIGNLDCTVILQEPKIKPHTQSIVKNLAEDLNITADSISLKGKTKEKVDATGEGRAVEAHAAVLLFQNSIITAF